MKAVTTFLINPIVPRHNVIDRHVIDRRLSLIVLVP